MIDWLIADVDEEENIYDEMPAADPPVPTQVSKVKATALPPDVGRVERIKECSLTMPVTRSWSIEAMMLIVIRKSIMILLALPPHLCQ